MPYLTDWKAAKKAFETATGKKKPSEKFLGIFNKSSGLENVLKALDAALAKKNPKEVAKAKDDYRKTFEAYYATMVKGAKAEENNQQYQQELVKLNVALNAILRGADEAERALETDPKALVTVEEAIGDDALMALNESQLVTHPNLVGWLNDGFAGAVMIAGQGIHDPDSIKYRAAAKAEFNKVKQQYDAFKALLPKVMERGKALAAAKMFIARVPEGITAIQEGIAFWYDAQKEAFKTNKAAGVSDDVVKEDINKWMAKSTAWKHALKLEPLWQHEVNFINDFRAAIK